MINQGWNFEHTYAELPGIFYSSQNPAAVPDPRVFIFNRELAEDMGLNAELLENAGDIFSGAALPDGAKPIAQAYAGYQFGHFAMLGDGRAILLGEHIAPGGRRLDVQLKGSGRTPYSRGGDGLAALAPMLREYIISEAMFSLGVPTTRSLAVALTGGRVMREQALPGAVLTRVAASHIRVGTFNYIAAYGSGQDLAALADYSIRRHFPWLEGHEDKYLLLLREVAELQAALIAKWQLAGFVHGVMNTDNMAVSGETIDYGPCAFMDAYNPDTVFSSIDVHGRYAYNKQPRIGAWNLSRFAESLLPLLGGDAELASAELDNYWRCYSGSWLAGMRLKLGLATEDPGDAGLIAELLGLMHEHELDYTATFRSRFAAPELKRWREKWAGRVDDTGIMDRHNPAVIPRNQRVEEALAAAGHGDLSILNSLLDALRKPYEYSEIYSSVPEKQSYCTFCGT